MRYSKLPLSDLITFFLSQGKEGEFWDFKQEWHETMSDLLKDIICLANTAHDENGFLIFGVADDLSLSGMKKDRRKQADIIDAISNLSFAGDIYPHITVESLPYQGVQLDILIVHNIDRTPIFLKKQYGEMRPGCIYARVGDKNTPNNGNAEMEVIERLWKKRFGLSKPAREFIYDALPNKLDWTETEKGYYHIYKPEYTLERACEDNYEIGAGSDEFYSYAQTNESTSYYDLDIKANNTVLDKYQIVVLDSGRLSIPVPERGYLYMDDPEYNPLGYIYYCENSNRYRLLNFMYDPENGDQRWAFNHHMKITLLFKSNYEKECFEDYVKHNSQELKTRIDDSNAYDYINTGSVAKTKGYIHSLQASVILKELLIEFRDFCKDFDYKD